MTPDEIEFLQQSNFIEGEMRDWALDDAVKAWSFVKGLDFFTIKDLLKAHRLLMHNIRPDLAGKHRTVDVRVGWKIMPKPAVAKKEIFDWCVDMRRMKPRGNDADKEFQCRVMHVAFEQVHPFEDGNGRIGRMFLNWQRLKFKLPILIIKEKEKEDYYKWFK